MILFRKEVQSPRDRVRDSTGFLLSRSCRIYVASEYTASIHISARITASAPIPYLPSPRNFPLSPALLPLVTFSFPFFFRLFRLGPLLSMCTPRLPCRLVRKKRLCYSFDRPARHGRDRRCLGIAIVATTSI